MVERVTIDQGHTCKFSFSLVKLVVSDLLFSMELIILSLGQHFPLRFKLCYLYLIYVHLHM